jgi:hypothetical protein
MRSAVRNPNPSEKPPTRNPASPPRISFPHAHLHSLFKNLGQKIA